MGRLDEEGQTRESVNTNTDDEDEQADEDRRDRELVDAAKRDIVKNSSAKLYESCWIIRAHPSAGRPDRAIRLNKGLTGRACQTFIPLLSLARRIFRAGKSVSLRGY
jgi:hypothetical protein